MGAATGCFGRMHVVFLPEVRLRVGFVVSGDSRPVTTNSRKIGLMGGGRDAYPTNHVDRPGVENKPSLVVQKHFPPTIHTHAIAV